MTLHRVPPLSSGHRSLSAVLAAAMLFAAGGASAHSYKAGALLIDHPWARATPPGATVGAGYFTIVNSGTVPERLTGGTLEAATGFEAHTMAMTSGVMTMRPAGPLTIPPGGTLTLSPAGTHIMFTGLKHPLRKGENVEGTLVFEHAGTVRVHFAVDAVGAKAPATSPGGAMPGMDMH